MTFRKQTRIIRKCRVLKFRRKKINDTKCGFVIQHTCIRSDFTQIYWRLVSNDRLSLISLRFVAHWCITSTVYSIVHSKFISNNSHAMNYVRLCRSSILITFMKFLHVVSIVLCSPVQYWKKIELPFWLDCLSIIWNPQWTTSILDLLLFYQTSFVILFSNIGIQRFTYE